MIDDRELTRRVTASLAAHADTVVLGDEPFDPERRMNGAPADLGIRPDRSRRPLLLAAAVLALAGTAAAAVALDGDRDGDDGRVTTERVALGAPPAPADAWAATWAPDGWERTGVSWGPPSSAFGADDVHLGWPPTGDRAQLFGDPEHPDDPGHQVLVESGGGVVAQDPTAGTIVRGQPAMASTPALGWGWTRNRPELRSVEWTEAGTPLRATFALADRDAALAFLDSLQVGAAGPSGGFHVAPGSDRSLLAEATAPAEPPTHVSTVHWFDRPTGRDYGLGVQTVAPGGGPTVDLVAARFYGERAADGTVTVWDAPSASLIVVDPDGRLVGAQVYTLTRHSEIRGVREVEGLGPSRAIAEQAAASVAPVTAGTLTGWWEDVNAAQAAHPLIARVELPSATIELRGDDAVEFVCQADQGMSACVPVVPDVSDIAVADLRIGGIDHVVAARSGEPPIIVAADESGGGRPVDAETGHDGDWYVASAPIVNGLVVEGTGGEAPD